MDHVLVACVQQRMDILASHEEFENQMRRFMRLAQAKAAQIVVFPELMGLMLAPPLFSGVKLGFMKQASQGRQPGTGPVKRGVKRVAEAAADALGGYRGSLVGLLKKKSDSLWEVYADSLGRLAREFGAVVVGGSLYVRDPETEAVRERACVFDVDGQLVGWQDKLNLTPDDQELAEPGTTLSAIDTRFGRLGLLSGWDALYPELARALAFQGAELLVGLAASPGVAQAQTIRSALALRAEENQVFAVASFLLGPNLIGRSNRDEYVGQSAVLAPISLTDRGSGVLAQVGTNRAEGLIAARLDYAALHRLWETSNFRPRQQMVLGDQGVALAERYRQGLTLEQAAARWVAPAEEPLAVQPPPPAEPPPVERAPALEPASTFARVYEAPLPLEKPADEPGAGQG